MSDSRSAQSAKAWMPNRMFDANANAFAVQNLLSKEEEKFIPEQGRSTRGEFVVDRLGREDEADTAQNFVAEGSDNAQQAHANEAPNQTDSESPHAQAGGVAQKNSQGMDTTQANLQPEAASMAQAAAANDFSVAADFASADQTAATALQSQSEITTSLSAENSLPGDSAGPSDVAITNMINAAREEAHTVAYQDGFLAGQIKAKEELQQQYDNKFAALQSLSDGVQELSNNADALFEPLKKLAIHLAEQIVRGELTQSGQAISRLIDNALREMGGSGEKTMIVHLNAEDLELFRPLAEQFGESITLRPNSTLKRGSVRVSLDGSVVEDLIERRLEGLNKSMAQPASGSWRNGQSTSLAARIDAHKRAGQAVEDVAAVDAQDVVLASADSQSSQDHA